MIRPKTRFLKEIPYRKLPYRNRFLIRNLSYKNGYKSDSICNGHGVLLKGASGMNHSLVRITEICAPCGRAVPANSVYGIAQNCGIGSVANSYANLRSTHCCNFIRNLLPFPQSRNGYLTILYFGGFPVTICNG